MKRLRPTSAVRVTGVYLLFSAVWIFGSDYVLSLIAEDVEEYWFYSSIKGILFILISGWIIYSLVKHEMMLWQEAQVSIQHLEDYDLLTGLYNRSRFQIELARYAADNLPLTIVLTDINGLRLINEISTPSAGDDVLRQYASLLRESMPDEAFIARIGGDEFCVLIPDCDAANVDDYLDTLNANIKQQSMEPIVLSVALGTSSSCADSLTAFDLMTLAEDRMQKNKLLLDDSSSNSLITSLKTTLFERTDETEQQTVRNLSICVRMGEKLRLTTSEINELHLFAILHDIGKIGISDTILNKPGKLTASEYNIMKQHSTIGFRIASSAMPLSGIAYLILTHHERWDGTGYPNGLKQQDIPLASRILAIADAYDAMTHDRIYRTAITHDAAIAELISNRGTQFDPTLVDLFLELYQNQPTIG